MSLELFAAEIWRTSWQGAALVAVVLVAQWLSGQRLPPRWRYNLWLVVVLRLIVPVSPESPLSLFNYVRVQPATILVETPPVSAPSVEPLPKAPAPTVHASAVVSGTASEAPLATSPGRSPEAIEPSPTVAMLMAPSEHTVRPLTWSRIAALLWLAGMVVLAARVGWVTLRTLRQVRRARPVQDTHVLALLASCQAQMGVRKPLPVLETPILQSPALFGLFRPVLLLPPGFTTQFSADELRHVFLHELAHVVRRDLAWSWLLTLLQILHWFNPAIWFGFARMRADRELASDALALSRSSDGEAVPYATTIIKLLESMARPAGSMPIVGILENRSQMARRIRMIAAFRPGRRWSFLALVLMSVLTVTGLTDAVRPTRLKVVDLATGLPIAGVKVYGPYGAHINYTEPPEPLVTGKDGTVAVPRQVLGWGGGVLAVHPKYASQALATIWGRSAGRPPQPRVEIPEENTIALRQGRNLGGVVQDESGRPIAGVRVEIQGMYLPIRDTDETTPIPYPAYSPWFNGVPVTDANGTWSCAHFPDTLDDLQFDFIRPGGASTRFYTTSDKNRMPPGGTLIETDELHRGLIVTTLPTGVTVRGVVRDDAGKPLAGITVTETDRRRGPPALVLQTDAEGRFELPHRDPHQVLLAMTGPGWATTARLVTITTEMPELDVRMETAQPLAVRVQGEDGQPLRGVAVSPHELKLGWKGETNAGGRIVWKSAPRTPIDYQFAKEGYRVLKTALAATEREQIVTMVRGGPQDGGESENARSSTLAGPRLAAFDSTLRLQDGRPAANATVAIRDPAKAGNRWTSISVIGGPRIEPQEGHTLARADATGRISLPALPGNSELVIVHKEGFLIVSAAGLKDEPEQRLPAWGRIDGTATLNGQPLARSRLGMQIKRGSFPSGIFYSNQATTDAAGNFTLETVPAGKHTIYRSDLSAGTGQTPQSNPVVVDVTAGESLRVSYDMSGRTVAGKLKLLPEGTDFDWNKNKGTVLIKRARGGSARPSYSDFVRYADYSASMDRWSAGLAAVFQDTYGGKIEADGSFQFEGVPPGDFELLIEASLHKNQQTVELGSLTVPVRVEANAPSGTHSLGAVDFPFKEGALPAKPPLDFAATDFTGRPVRLADFRGKFVLLNFWASWAPLSAEKLALLKSLMETSGTHPQFALLNVSLDDSVDAARTYVEAQGLPGLQARLEGRAKSVVTEALEVDELPTLLFIGPDGRLRSRALPEGRWRTTITSALNP